MATALQAIPSEYRYATLDPEDWPEIDFNAPGVVLLGETGIGKTWAASALLRKTLLENFPWTVVLPEGGYPKRAILWVSVPRLMIRIRASFSPGSKETEDEIVQELAGAGMLLMDDLGAEKATEFSSETLYSIIAERRNARRRTIVTSNLTLDQIASRESRIADRLAEFYHWKLPERVMRTMRVI